MGTTTVEPCTGLFDNFVVYIAEALKGLVMAEITTQEFLRATALTYGTPEPYIFSRVVGDFSVAKAVHMSIVLLLRANAQAS